MDWYIVKVLFKDNTTSRTWEARYVDSDGASYFLRENSSAHGILAIVPVANVLCIEIKKRP